MKFAIFKYTYYRASAGEIALAAFLMFIVNAATWAGIIIAVAALAHIGWNLG